MSTTTMNAASDPHDFVALLEICLKHPGRLDELFHERSRQPGLMARLLAIALLGFTAFGLALGLMRSLFIAGDPLIPGAPWSRGSTLSMILAYDIGLIASCGVCLPSFYFYGLLAGVRESLLTNALHCIKALALTGVALVGLLPIYVALALGAVVFEMDPHWQQIAGLIGLCLPFVAGLYGVSALYAGFVRLAETIPPERRHRRALFLRRLILAWAICYTAVTPVMVFTLWQQFAS